MKSAFHGKRKKHKHTCEVCRVKFTCGLPLAECNAIQDGGSVCGPCAIGRFDAIANYPKWNKA